jgi:hypothetical protein
MLDDLIGPLRLTARGDARATGHPVEAFGVGPSHPARSRPMLGMRCPNEGPRRPTSMLTGTGPLDRPRWSFDLSRRRWEPSRLGWFSDRGGSRKVIGPPSWPIASWGISAEGSPPVVRPSEVGPRGGPESGQTQVGRAPGPLRSADDPGPGCRLAAIVQAACLGRP